MNTRTANHFETTLAPSTRNSKPLPATPDELVPSTQDSSVNPLWMITAGLVAFFVLIGLLTTSS